MTTTMKTLESKVKGKDNFCEDAKNGVSSVNPLYAIVPTAKGFAVDPVRYDQAMGVTGEDQARFYLDKAKKATVLTKGD